jgi:hypothetical protein
MRTFRSVLLALLGVAGCAQSIAEVDGLFYDWDGRKVICAAGLDPVSRNSLESVFEGMERAVARDEVLMLYAHSPGKTVPVERIEAILGFAEELGLPFFTARELAEGGERRAGVHLGFDDAAVDEWFEIRGMLAAYGARVSFYVTRYDGLGRERQDKLRMLRDEGHSVEAHSLRHLVAPDYVEEHGLRAYMNEEALPSIELLRADGFDPVVYAYPFGARTGELDRALLEHVKMVRAVTFAYAGPLIADPCP